MAIVVLPIEQKKNAPARLLEAHEESFLDEVFGSEQDFEEALIPRVGELVRLLGVDSLHLIGRQVSLKTGNALGRGLTLDLYAISETGRRYVVELKIAQDKSSVVQGYNYAAQLRSDDVDTICLTYASYLTRTQGREVTSEEAAELIADFLGVTVDELPETELTANPGIVVITPSVSAEEYAAAKALEADGNIVAIISVSCQVGKNLRSLNLERFFPALEPHIDVRKNRQARKLRSRAAGRDEQADTKRAELELAILTHLNQLGEDSSGMMSRDLRQVTGSKPGFTKVVSDLAERGLIARAEGESDKPGRKPLMNKITDEGRAFLSQPVSPDTTEIVDPA